MRSERDYGGTGPGLLPPGEGEFLAGWLKLGMARLIQARLRRLFYPTPIACSRDWTIS